jgi:hypothetical protein
MTGHWAIKRNDRGEITDPNVGEAEITRMDFDSSGVRLHIKLASPQGTLMLQTHNLRWLSFTTDCPQNVIESIVITTDLTEASEFAPKSIREMLWARDQTIPGQTARPIPLQALIVRPAAGPALACIADDVLAFRDTDDVLGQQA